MLYYRLGLKMKKSNSTPKSNAPQKERETPIIRATQNFPIIAVGASAGGLEAFEALFENMPTDLGAGFVLLAHLDPTHISILPELIQRRTKMPVHQIEDGMQIEPNHIYVIPSNKKLSILHGNLQLLDSTPQHGARLPIDSFLQALAQDQGKNAVCIILSGTGSDGSQGIKAIKSHLGMVMVQDEASAKFDGMPRNAMATGLVDYVLSPKTMPTALSKFLRHIRSVPEPLFSGTQGDLPAALKKIFLILRSRTNHDFSLYKLNTISRRIERRMHVQQQDKIGDYVKYLQESNTEADILFKEMLIGVTNFFRDQKAFELLRQKVLPDLLSRKETDGHIRVWVPGCSTGEEAFSLAILFHEIMEQAGHHFQIQIFATDIDEIAIDIARRGSFSASISTDVSPDRLRRYFTKADNGSFQVKRVIREMLVFARQDVISDPPFTKLDMLSCRNLLIYLGSELQQKLIPLFHYSLLPKGILFLGTSESVGASAPIFTALDKKWKLFTPITNGHKTIPSVLYLKHPKAHTVAPTEVSMTNQHIENQNLFQLVKTLLKQADSPPCAIIDHDSNVVYTHGRVGQFLEPVEGRPSNHILEMAKAGIKRELLEGIRQIIAGKREAVYSKLRVADREDFLHLKLTIKPLQGHVNIQHYIIVIFEEQSASPLAKGTGKKQANSKSTVELEQELHYTRDNLQLTIEELETSNEELKSANEELQSTNEEMQSSNEELETSKEELHSLNEESMTVNSELQARIEELTHTSNDLKNLLDSTAIATVFLDIDLNIRRFTPSATGIIPLTLNDQGRPLGDLATNLLDADLVGMSRLVLEDLALREQQVQSVNGTYYTIHFRPYRTMKNVIDGVVITFQNITQRVHAEQLMKRSKELAESIVSHVHEPLLVLDEKLKVVSANPAFAGRFELKEHEVEGRFLFDLADGRWNIPKLRKALEQVITKKAPLKDLTVEYPGGPPNLKSIVLNGRLIPAEGPQEALILMLISTEELS